MKCLELTLASLAVASSVRAEAAGLRWDHQGRLARATLASHDASYFYGEGPGRVLEDHAGSVTFYIGQNFEIRDGISITYARFGERRVARLGQSNLQAQLLPDPAHSKGATARTEVGDAWLLRERSEPSRRVLYASARRLLLDHAPAAVSLHQDHLGNATLATDARGRLLADCAFQADGALRACHGYLDGYTFTNQRRDPTTDLLHFQYRELDARAAHWISPDPLFLTDARACLAKPFECANGYQYVLNNPVDLIDPTGQDAEAAEFQTVRVKIHKADDGKPSISLLIGNSEGLVYLATKARYEVQPEDRDAAIKGFETQGEKAWVYQANPDGVSAMLSWKEEELEDYLFTQFAKLLESDLRLRFEPPAPQDARKQGRRRQTQRMPADQDDNDSLGEAKRMLANARPPPPPKQKKRGPRPRPAHSVQRF
ncbi:MAG: RHS repeat-associated core domain-containing protein [Myxococcales bacterium]